MALTHSPATDGQKKQIARVINDAAAKAIEELNLDKSGAQRVHAHGDELAAAINTATTESLKKLSTPDKYGDEQVRSDYHYGRDYPGPKDLREQINLLRMIFPEIGNANEDFVAMIEHGRVALPSNAEGWFAIPNWVHCQRIFGSTYCEALKTVLKAIEKQSGLHSKYPQGVLSSDYFRQTSYTRDVWADISNAQGNPGILIIPAQFGLFYRGKSVRRARELFAANEFGLSAFAVGAMLLTHSKRLRSDTDLGIDCPGDECTHRVSSTSFDSAPCFNCRAEKVVFGLGCDSEIMAWFGSASGFLLH